MKSKKLTIAIDGFSACGKSTLAKDLAKKLDYIFIDSGAMYRGVALYCLKNQLFSDGEPLVEKIKEQLNHINLEFKTVDQQSLLFLNGINVANEIRENAVASVVSKIATIKEVRQKLVAEQQKMGQKGGIIMDGRDIGSVVFPNAELKLFVTADTKIRTQRRLDELKSKGIESSYDEVAKNLEERDFIDSTRAESPLIQVDDAIVLDNSNLNRDEQVEWVLQILAQHQR
jgi:cytidylate kinase